MIVCQRMQSDLTVYNTDCMHHTELLLLNTNVKQSSLEKSAYSDIYPLWIVKSVNGFKDL